MFQLNNLIWKFFPYTSFYFVKKYSNKIGNTTLKIKVNISLYAEIHLSVYVPFPFDNSDNSNLIPSKKICNQSC